MLLQVVGEQTFGTSFTRLARQADTQALCKGLQCQILLHMLLVPCTEQDFMPAHAANAASCTC